MKTQNTLAASAQNVDKAYEKVINSRRNLKAKRTMFLQAQTANQEAEFAFAKAKEAHDQLLTERA